MSINLLNIKDVNIIYLAALAFRIDIHSIYRLVKLMDLCMFPFDLHAQSYDLHKILSYFLTISI
jgi:hypothetical protein